MSTKRVAKILLVLAFMAAPFAGADDALARDNSEPMPLLKGWEYRWGDSPVKADGTFAWLYEDADADWFPMPALEWPENRDGEEWIWYRTTLPSGNWPHAAIYLPNVALAFDAYVGTDLIYEFGVKSPDIRNKYTITDVHVIPLPPGYQGGTLSLRVYSNVFIIGFEGTVDPPLIGSQEDIIRAVFLDGAESLAIGLLLVFAGLFALLTFFSRFRKNPMAPLSFAAFSICLGLFYIATQSSTQFAVESQALKMYTLTLSFIFFPVGMFSYLQFTVFRESSALIRRIIWAVFWLHLGSAVVVTVLDLVNIIPASASLRPYNILFAATVPVALVTTLTQAVRGSVEAKIVMWGFIVFSLTGLADLLQGLEVLPYLRWMSQWGALFFVACLGYVLEREFAESHRRLREYSLQLEEKSGQLAEYSHTLEDKVAARTRDLDEKNKQLVGAMRDLKDAQQQLVMREKMASLGRLVAGVAHEVNTPIGAVMSASDVSSRAARVVRGFVHERTEEESDRVRKASDLIVENSRVISEAARRVSEIVKSLKNFARLEEAEFQTVDIHEGIDSTLTLVAHRMKDRITVKKAYGDLPKLPVFPNQLNQVFMNLIVNAVDAIDGEGAITIETGKDTRNAYIKVSDTGKGIAAEDISRVFDPGFTKKGVGVGTGLGLSISYNIVQKHRGALHVESEPGKGATFTVVLPLRPGS